MVLRIINIWSWCTIFHNKPFITLEMVARRKEQKMKKCKKCHYYTGVQCHGHGEFWGECKKNKNTLFCYDDTPCLQDVKTLRELYFRQIAKINELEMKTTSAETWQTRYEIKCRHLKKCQDLYQTAEQYIPKEKYKEYWQKKIEILNMSSKK